MRRCQQPRETSKPIFNGGPGNDPLNGGNGDDTINGLAGNDTLDGGAGTDSMIGGTGNDFYFASATDVVVEAAGEGIDGIAGAKTSIAVAAFATTVENLFYTGAAGATVTGNAMINIVAGGIGADTIVGGDGNDSVAGGTGADSVTGGNGDDDLYGGGLFQFFFGPGTLPDTAVDTLVGGTGDDLHWIDTANDVITELAAGGTRDVVISSIDNSLAKYANVEALVLRAGTDAWYGRGTTGDDILVGNTADNDLVGGAGNDTVSGSVDLAGFIGAASDVLDGGDGNDSLFGSGFGDALNGDAGNDSLEGGLGNDTLNGGAVAASPSAFQGVADVLWGNAPFVAQAGDADPFRLAAPTVANKAVETFTGSGTFHFNAGALIMDFSAGSDTIRLAAGMVGDNDTVLEGAVVKDTAGGTFASAAEMVNFRTDALAGFNSFSTLTAFNAGAATTVIGGADAAFAVGAERVFVIDNGASSAIFQFTAANADAAVTQDELSLLAVVNATATLAVADFGLF